MPRSSYVPMKECWTPYSNTVEHYTDMRPEIKASLDMTGPILAQRKKDEIQALKKAADTDYTRVFIKQKRKVTDSEKTNQMIKQIMEPQIIKMVGDYVNAQGKTIYSKLPDNIRTISDLHSYALNEVTRGNQELQYFQDSCLEENYNADGTLKDNYFSFPKDKTKAKCTLTNINMVDPSQRGKN